MNRKSKARKLRTRSGCFTCRDRHLKCDEQKPVCQNCINSRRKCYRGIRLNFTQYTLYDPKDSHHITFTKLADLEEPLEYRILDQSIAISSLYEEGLERYKRFKKLHKPEDLEEASNQLLLELLPKPLSTTSPQNATKSPSSRTSFDENNIHYSSNLRKNSTYENLEYPFNTTNQAFFDLRGNMIMESYDIKNYLLNHQQRLNSTNTLDLIAEERKKQTPDPKIFQHRSNSMANIEPELILNPSNINSFISVIQSQNFSWLLDLFNESNIWRSIIPNYCIKLMNASEVPNTSKRARMKLKFLFGCLLCCTEHTPLEKITDLGKVQLDAWREFQSKDVTIASFPAFERLLLSVVLLLHALLLQTFEPNFKYHQKFAIVLANQGRMFLKLITRYQRISSSKIKRMSSSRLTITAFQTITILRFFLKMCLKLKCNVSLMADLCNDHKVSSPLELSIQYDDETPNIADFFVLSSFELDNLVLSIQEYGLDSPEHVSDSNKLRHCIFRLIHQDYVAKNYSAEQVPRINDFGESSILIPNEKCIALNLLNFFSVSKFHNSKTERQTAKSALQHIFKMIRTSMMAEDSKSKWVLYFDWTLL